jgi:predicted metal-binding protein
LVDVLNDKFFVILDFHGLLSRSSCNIFGREKLVETVTVRRVELMMVIVQPEVILKLNLFCLCFGSDLKAPDLAIFEEENVFLFNWRVLMVCLEDLRHDFVVKFLVHQV